MANDCLDYIKETGKEIKELNDKLEAQRIKNEALKDEINKLNIKNEQYDNELTNVRKLANKWWREYDELSDRYNNLEGKYDFLAQIIAQSFGQVIAQSDDLIIKEFVNEFLEKYKKEYRW